MSEARKVEPVAEVESWTNGSYHRNYKLKWLKDVEQGTKLYSEPVMNPTTDHTFIRAYEVGAKTYPTVHEANKAIYRGEGDRWYPLYRANREVEAVEPAVVEPEPCEACMGTGRMVRDPDIGTDQECFVCDGTRVNTLDPTPQLTPTQEIAALKALLTRARRYVDGSAWELHNEIDAALKTK
jgi:hypothetical protein